MPRPQPRTNAQKAGPRIPEIPIPAADPDGLPPRVIRGLLRMHGITVREIARNLAVTEGFVHQVISKLRPTRRVRRAVHEAIAGSGLDYQAVWGGGPAESGYRAAPPS